MARHLLSRSRRSSSRGVSILEVLFAILISAIGLMGAISVFPAAMLQVRRGQQTDAAATGGLSGLAAFDAQGMRRPDQWLYYSGSAYTTVAAPDGIYAYCIDPRFVAANPNNTSANLVPYGGVTGYPAAYRSAMGRVSLPNGLSGVSAGPMSALLADLNFGIPDDIAYDRFRDGVVVRDNTLQAASLFVRDGSNNALKRESQGHMSWMATLAPKLERLPTGATLEDRYVLSIVIFYDRPSQLQAGSGYPASEWDLSVDMVGTPASFGRGVTGGDMRLTGTSAEQVDIKNGQWIMLMGYTQYNDPSGSGSSRISPMCRWYKVIDAAEPNLTANSVDVTLFGPDWDVNANTTIPLPARAIVFKGVVAVYEKTIQLESRL